MRDTIRLLRPKHYIKNVTVLLPLIFSKNLFQQALFFRAISGFILFCLISSAVYIFNDIMDAPQDRSHPEKCRRPIASGAITPGRGAALAIGLTAVTVLFGIVTGLPASGWVILGGYALLNIGYSLGLKNIPIVDIAILVIGFCLRVQLGAEVTGIAVSNWLYLTMISLSFYLSLGKRRNELTRQNQDTRQVLTHYNYGFLDKNMQICMALTIVFYALWATDDATTLHLGHKLLWTVPLVICLFLKYSLTVEGDSSGDPVEVIFKDKILLIMAAIFAVITLALLYL